MKSGCLNYQKNLAGWLSEGATEHRDRYKPDGDYGTPSYW